LVVAPASRDICLTERRHEARLVIDHAEAVEVAAVLRGERRDEGWLPAGDEAVLGVERAEAGEVRGHQPELALSEGDLMDADVAREVLVPREEAGVVLAPGLHLRRDRRKVTVVQHLRSRPDRDPSRSDGEAHRAGKVPEV